MPYDPLNPPVKSLTQSQLLAALVSNLNQRVAMVAREIDAAYQYAVTQIQANPNGLSAAQINAALDADAASNGRMSSAQVAVFGSVAKAVFNLLSPGHVDDINPPATIALPA